MCIGDTGRMHYFRFMSLVLLRKNTLTSLLALALLSGCGSAAPDITQRPIPFGPERRDLTRAYLSDRYGIQQDHEQIQPQMVVLHWTAIPTLEGSFEAFYPETLPGKRSDIQNAGSLNVSAHYLVDRDGAIYQLMPDTLMARHVIGLNHCAIGIENVGGTKDTPLTPAQVAANVALVRLLASRHPIRYLLGHHEYTAFEGHPLWKERDSGYRTTKSDPGEAFMKKIRRKLRDLNLEGPPQSTIQ